MSDALTQAEAENPAGTPAPERVTELVIDEKFIDGYGHVTYLGYPILFERERARFMDGLGLGAETVDSLVPQYFVREMEIKYKRQVRQGDAVRILTRAERHTRFSIRYIQSIEIDEQTATQFECVIALVGENGQLFPIPEEISSKLFPKNSESD